MLDFSSIAADFENPRIEQQMRFITEIDKMKHILRRTILLDGSRCENDAEHSWHLAVMAQLLAEYATESFCMERVLKMVIVHDLIEVYAGDTFAFDVQGNKDKDQREKDAADTLFALLPKEQGDEIRTLWEEFDTMNTSDSRYAAALDRLQPFLHNALTEGHTWKLGNVTRQQVINRMQPTLDALPAMKPFIMNTIRKNIEAGYILL